MQKRLSERSTSGFPLSIGTSLALETIFDPVSPVYDESRSVTKVEDLRTYTLLAFNVSTLMRNLLTSLSYAEILAIGKKEIYETLLEEIEFLTNFCSSNGVEMKWYLHKYSYVKNVYESQGKLRKITTDRQHFFNDMTNYCLNQLAKQDDVVEFSKNISFDKSDKCLIFTHIPFDLLSYTNFIRLDLLESHTGVIKTRKDWWTKYYELPGEDMSFLPLMEYFLSVFGDNVMFKPDTIENRKKLINSLKRTEIHPLSSEMTLGFMKLLG